MTWRQLAFYHDKSLEKRISKNHFTFQKETAVEPGEYALLGDEAMVSVSFGWPYYVGLSEKNVPDTCCMDIKTKANKEEER